MRFAAEYGTREKRREGNAAPNFGKRKIDRCEEARKKRQQMRS